MRKYLHAGALALRAEEHVLEHAEDGSESNTTSDEENGGIATVVEVEMPVGTVDHHEHARLLAG